MNTRHRNCCKAVKLSGLLKTHYKVRKSNRRGRKTKGLVYITHEIAPGVLYNEFRRVKFKKRLGRSVLVIYKNEHGIIDVKSY